MIEAFEGNKAETMTMLPVITAFMAAAGCPMSPLLRTRG